VDGWVPLSGARPTGAEFSTSAAVTVWSIVGIKPRPIKVMEPASDVIPESIGGKVFASFCQFLTVLGRKTPENAMFLAPWRAFSTGLRIAEGRGARPWALTLATDIGMLRSWTARLPPAVFGSTAMRAARILHYVTDRGVIVNMRY